MSTGTISSLSPSDPNYPLLLQTEVTAQPDPRSNDTMTCCASVEESSSTSLTPHSQYQEQKKARDTRVVCGILAKAINESGPTIPVPSQQMPKKTEEIIEAWVRENQSKLQKVKSLDLSAMVLSTLPEWLQSLTSLETLDISCNDFSSLPEWMQNFTHLKELKHFSNQLGVLPEWVRNLTNLEKHELTTLPDSIGHLTNLKVLGFGLTSSLSTLPPEIRLLTSLQPLLPQLQQLMP